MHADTQHGRANTLKRAQPGAEDIFCHWCLSTDINHRQGKCLCVLLNAGQSIHRKSILFQDYVLVLHIYYHCIRLISPLEHVLFTSSRQRGARINILLWSFLTRIITHMIICIDLYSENDFPPWFTLHYLASYDKSNKRRKNSTVEPS